MVCFYQYISVFERRYDTKMREMVLAPFRQRNSFNNSRKDGKCCIDLVGSMLNTLRTVELGNVFHLFTWKHYHIPKWSPNIIQWFMYEATVKYVIMQGPGCVKQGIKPICAKLHIFPKIDSQIHSLHQLRCSSICVL